MGIVAPTGSSGKSAAVTTASTPFERLGARGVDAADAGVRVRAAQQLGVHHAGQLEVGRVDRLAGDALPGIDAGQRACRRL